MQKELNRVHISYCPRNQFELEEYTLSVTVAGIASEPRDFHEIPIVIGSDAEHKNAHQIFISRRPTHIAFRHARRVNGQYSITFDSNLDYIMEDDTFFTITIQVSGINANLFLNGEYVTTISEDSGFKGYLGFRWTNSLDFKSIELYEGIVEPETPEATEKPEETQTPKPTDKQEETPAPTETEKPSGTTPSNTDTDDEKEKNGMLPVIIGGVVLAVIVVVCIIVIAKSRKNK